MLTNRLKECEQEQEQKREKEGLNAVECTTLLVCPDENVEQLTSAECFDDMCLSAAATKTCDVDYGSSKRTGEKCGILEKKRSPVLTKKMRR